MYRYANLRDWCWVHDRPLSLEYAAEILRQAKPLAAGVEPACDLRRWDESGDHL